MIEALESLREWSHCVDNAYVADNGFMFAEINAGGKIREFADEIQVEVEDGYMRLPVDADGMPIRVGDEMDTTMCASTVIGIGPDYFVTGERIDDSRLARDGWNLAKNSHHSKPRTVEDVLREIVKLAENTGNGRLDDGDIEGFADEIRELMAND